MVIPTGVGEFHFRCLLLCVWYLISKADSPVGNLYDVALANLGREMCNQAQLESNFPSWKHDTLNGLRSMDSHSFICKILSHYACHCSRI